MKRPAIASSTESKRSKGREAQPQDIDSDATDAVVKVFAAVSEPNYGVPWVYKAQDARTGTAFAVWWVKGSNRWLLTNAHVVRHAAVIQVRKRGDHQKFIAKVLCVGLDCDLAILTVEDKKFWEALPRVHLSEELPNLQDEVTVVGYPIGGDNACVTVGVVSRIDMQRYNMCWSRSLLAIQIDAAINPGLGREDAENIGCIIPSEESLAGFRKVPKTGVIYVMDEASKAGYCAATAQEWANLGQGSPETTRAKNWPTNIRKRLTEMVEKGKLTSELGPFSLQTLEVNEENLHYSSVNGDWALRRAVAKYYNEIYRKGKASLYTAENVAIVGGGRLALTRLCCAMDNVNLGHFLPDYTAYAELLSQFKTINSIPIPLDPKNNFTITLQELRREIVGRGLSVLLLSNPCNPTGQLIEGEELKNWCRIARETQCSLVLDEIYSRYIYTQRMSPTDATWRMVSAAQFVDDVNQDPVIILDGLTKCWRMPGLHICWIVAPKSVIDAVGAAGSFLDGGPSLPTQRSCVPLLNPKDVIEQTVMLQVLFSHKRDFLLRRLQDMGITVEHPPQGTFYCWCDISNLPPPLNNCWGFFRELLKEKVIVTPGVFFDVNPGSRRKFNSYDSFIRISYGPSFKEVQRGLEGMQRVIERQKRLQSVPEDDTMGSP